MDDLRFSVIGIVLFPKAWTTAAVDNERVIGAVPIVMDILNLQKVSFLIRSSD